MMKGLILIVAGLMCFGANAEGRCSKIGELAGNIMKTRQAGVDMSEVMNVAGDNKLLVAMTIAAFDTPAYQIDKNQKREISKFKNEWMLSCYKAKNNGGK